MKTINSIRKDGLDVYHLRIEDKKQLKNDYVELNEFEKRINAGHLPERESGRRATEGTAHIINASDMGRRKLTAFLNNGSFTTSRENAADDPTPRPGCRA